MLDEAAPGCRSPSGKASRRVVPLRVEKDGVELEGKLDVDGELVLHGGSLTLEPGAPPLTASTSVPDAWSISHAEDVVAHELRIAMPKGGAAPANQVVVGAWKDDKFVPSLTVDASGTVVIAGNLVVTGRLKASSVQEAQLSAAVARTSPG